MSCMDIGRRAGAVEGTRERDKGQQGEGNRTQTRTGKGEGMGAFLKGKE